MANDTPSDVDAACSIERMAIRRARDSCRALVDALGELEQAIDVAPEASRRGIVKGVALLCGDAGMVLHEVRRELLSMEGLYPW